MANKSVSSRIIAALLMVSSALNSWHSLSFSRVLLFLTNLSFLQKMYVFGNFPNSRHSLVDYLQLARTSTHPSSWVPVAFKDSRSCFIVNILRQYRWYLTYSGNRFGSCARLISRILLWFLSLAALTKLSQERLSFTFTKALSSLAQELHFIIHVSVSHSASRLGQYKTKELRKLYIWGHNCIR